MYCCFAADRGFRDEDFDGFKVGAWLTATSEMMREHGIEPHVALVAARCREQVSSVRP